MSDKQFRAFLDLMMCSDPWPILPAGDSHETLNGLADKEAEKRGFDDWYVAFHEFKKP